MKLLSPRDGKAKLTTRELILLALMGAAMFVLQVAMAALPNIHPIAPLIIATTVVFGWKTLYSIGVFILLEGFIHGFGMWWFSYLYVWPLLMVLAMLLKGSDSPLFWAAVAGGFGLIFGAMCSLPYFFIGGPSAAFAYWVSGIPFDLLHCGGNFAATLVLYRPVTNILKREWAENR